MEAESANTVDFLEEFAIVDKNKLKEDITCKVCSALLNIPPIFFNETLGSVCGRCHSNARKNNGTLIRENLFEKLAQNMTYPCANKENGCMDILKWNEIQMHELSCAFQTCRCPFFIANISPHNNCDWLGTSQQLNKHVLITHKENILDPPELTFSEEQSNSIYFAYVDSQLIIIIVKHENDQKYNCLLLYNGNESESQCFRSQLELYENSKSKSTILCKNRLEPVGSILESLNCPEKMLQVDLSKIKEILQSQQSTQNIMGVFSIVKKNKQEIERITCSERVEMLNTPSDSDILDELECPVCMEYMTSPIYCCDNGHSVCSDCKQKVTSCPTCRSTYNGIRNFALEKLTLKVKYPCRNRESGCRVVLTSDKIRQHGNICNLSQSSCILGCEWEGIRSAMYNHVFDNHSSEILQFNQLVQIDVNDCNIIHHYVLHLAGELFRLSIHHDDELFNFNVEHFGMMEGVAQYIYHAKLANMSDILPHIIIANECKAMRNLSDVFDESISLCNEHKNKILNISDEDEYLNFMILKIARIK